MIPASPARGIPAPAHHAQPRGWRASLRTSQIRVSSEMTRPDRRQRAEQRAAQAAAAARGHVHRDGGADTQADAGPGQPARIRPHGAPPAICHSLPPFAHTVVYA